MINNIIADIKKLKNQKNIDKSIQAGCKLATYGVKIGDLKLLIKKYAIKNDNNLAIELYDTNIYDAMVLACLIVNIKTIQKEILIKWVDQTEYMDLIESRIGYLCAEHPDYEFFLDTFKPILTDKYQTIYYMIIGGRLFMDPDFDKSLVNLAIEDIKQNILTINLIRTKYQLNTLVGTIGVQVLDKTQQMLDLHKSYQIELEAEFNALNIKFSNPTNFIHTMQKNNCLAKHRKMCRC